VSLRRSISKVLFGLSVPQEYICLAREKLTQPFSSYLTGNDYGFCQDITTEHLFLGYKPVIIGIPINAANSNIIHKHKEFCLSVSSENFDLNSKWRGFATSRKSIARLILKKVDIIDLKSTAIAVFCADHGEHSFISTFHQSINEMKQRMKATKKDFISLEGNLADQVRIAYAIPRVVSLSTLLDENGNMNMFPTDLHGYIGDTFYASSLRVGGKANDQVSSIKQIVLSDIDPEHFREVYALGKNHMKDPQPVSALDVQGTSERFRIPLPKKAIGYRELLAERFIDIGIHRVYFYRVINDVSNTSTNRLTHFHQYAAQWRDDHGLQTPSLIR
jgi:hypothetical protein